MDIGCELELFKNNTVNNWHEHVSINAETGKLNITECDRLAAHAKLLYQDMVAISIPLNVLETPEKMEACNDAVAEACSRYPELFRGMTFVDPHHGRFSVAEIERCVKGLGFVGVKMYHQKKLDDPMQYPIIEKCIELDIPILMHAGKLSQPLADTQPNLADVRQFVNISKRYPEAVFLMAHIGGGGDWFWQLKGIAGCPNVFVDISGSVYDFGIVEETVAVFGAERILYGADGSFSSGAGKLLGAQISKEDKITILGGPRFAKYLNRKVG